MVVAHSTAQNMRQSPARNVNEDRLDPDYQRQKWSPMTVLSGNIWFMRIFEGVLWEGGAKRQSGCRQWQFLAFSLALLLGLRYDNLILNEYMI